MQNRWRSGWRKTTEFYGTALNNNLREISFAIYNELRPEIVVISSSRGSDFRREFFKRSFSCVCSIMSNIDEGVQFFEAVKDNYLPKVAVIALDYWWFSATDDHSTVPWRGYGSAVKLTRPNILSPYDWIAEGKISLADFLSVSFGDRDRSDLSAEPKLGVQAIKLSNGTRADGTWSPLGTASLRNWPEESYGHMDRLIREPEIVLQERAGRYSPDQKMSEETIAKLEGLVAAFQKRGSKVVLLMLPIATPIIEFMEKSGRYKFIGDVRQRMSLVGAEYYDFFDPRSFDSNACEFKDPHHGGNAMYARMLMKILDRNPSSALQDYVDYPRVEDIQRRFAGRIVATVGTESAQFHEKDFLRLGCQK